MTVQATAGASMRIAGALADLRADFGEQRFLCRDMLAKLDVARGALEAAPLQAATRDLLVRELGSAQRRCRSVLERLQGLGEPAWDPSPSRVCELAEEKRSTADLLRTEQALVAALICAADWQSPSFLHSVIPATGRQVGRIRAHWNDYKRDRHLDADEFERRYVAAMVDGAAPPRALLTSCGMAAFTTILAFLALEGELDGPVLAGAGLYHESRLLLERTVRGRLHIVDEAGGALVDAIDELRPSAVFLDSLANTAWMPVPDLAGIIGRLTGTQTRLVVDNTCLSVGWQPFALAGPAVRLIVFESLLKYAQLGLDRANAGVILARGDDARTLATYREHLGTNIADVAVNALPTPDRAVLGRRLARVERNAVALAERLRAGLGSSATVVYPGAAAHPCAGAASALTFRGGCLSILLGDGDPGRRREPLLVEAAVAEAARRGVALHAGASFGLDTSRIYATSPPVDYGDPYVRIAAGTEHELELARLADVLLAAVREVLTR